MNELSFEVEKNKIFGCFLINTMSITIPKCIVAFDEKYKTYTSVVHIPNRVKGDIKQSLQPAIDMAIQVCAASGHDISESIILNRLYTVGNAEWDMIKEIIESIREQYREINSQYDSEVRYRQSQKESRGLVTGGGFGLSGALKGMLTASAINMATGVAYDILNSVDNNKSLKNANSLKDSILHDKSIKNAFDDCLIMLISDINYIVYNEITEGADYFDLDKVDELYDKIISNKVNDEERMELYKQLFQEYPLDYKFYKSFINDYKDEHGDVENVANFFGIDITIDKIKIIQKRYNKQPVKLFWFDDCSHNLTKCIKDSIEAIHKMDGLCNEYSLKNNESNFKQLTFDIFYLKDNTADNISSKDKEKKIINYIELREKCLKVDGIVYDNFNDSIKAAEKWDNLTGLLDFSSSSDCQIYDFDDTSENLSFCIDKALNTIKKIDEYANAHHIEKSEYQSRAYVITEISNSYTYDVLCKKCRNVDGISYATFEQAKKALEKLNELRSIVASVDKNDYASVIQKIKQISDIDYNGNAKNKNVQLLESIEKELRTVNGKTFETYKVAQEARLFVYNQNYYMNQVYPEFCFVPTRYNKLYVQKAYNEITDKFCCLVDQEWKKRCLDFINQCDEIESVKVSSNVFSAVILFLISFIIITFMITNRMMISTFFKVVLSIVCFILICNVFAKIENIKKNIKYYDK